MTVTFDPGQLRRLRRWAWVAVAAVLLVWIGYLVREIWLPFGIAILIAMVLDPLVDRMERRGWSRAWAAALIFLVFFAVAGAVLYFLIPTVAAQAGRISSQVSQYIPAPGNAARAQTLTARLMQRSHAPPYVRAAVARGLQQLSGGLNQSAGWLSAHLMTVLSNLIWLVIIPIVTFYALKDFHIILGKALLLVPRERRDLAQALFAEVTGIFARYLRGLALVSVLNGAATALLLWALGMPNSLTLGAIAGVLYTVPYLGALLTIVLTAGVAFLAKGLGFLLIVVGASVLLHQVLFDQIISPRIVGGEVGLHPILSIFALLVGNLLLGIVGMILAVPVAASIQIVVVALVPKLSHEIELAPSPSEPPDTPDRLAEETMQQHAATDATEDLHRTVSQAVEQIEDKQKAADSQAA